MISFWEEEEVGEVGGASVEGRVKCMCMVLRIFSSERRVWDGDGGL